MLRMLSRSTIRSVMRKIACVGVLCAPALAMGAPVALTEGALDSVTAGYVDLKVDAVANATGANPVAIGLTNVDIQVSEPDQDGNVYTTAMGDGFALARGESVFTDVGYQLDTDEQIVSFDLKESTRNSQHRPEKKKSNKKSGNHKNKNKKSSKQRKKNQKNNKSKKSKNKNKKHKNKNKNNKKKKNKKNKKNRNNKKKNKNKRSKNEKKKNKARKKRNSNPEKRVHGDKGNYGKLAAGEIQQTQRLRIKVVTVRNVNL